MTHARGKWSLTLQYIANKQNWKVYILGITASFYFYFPKSRLSCLENCSYKKRVYMLSWNFGFKGVNFLNERTRRTCRDTIIHGSYINLFGKSFYIEHSFGSKFYTCLFCQNDVNCLLNMNIGSINLKVLADIFFIFSPFCLF